MKKDGRYDVSGLPEARFEPGSNEQVLKNRLNVKKTAARKGKVIFIDALNEVTRERAQSFLKPEHQQRILTAYKTFTDVPGFAKLATLAEIGANAGNLSIPLYVKRIAAAVATDSNGDAVTLRSAWDQWQTDGRAFWQQMDALLETLDTLEHVQGSGAKPTNHAK